MPQENVPERLPSSNKKDVQRMFNTGNCRIPLQCMYHHLFSSLFSTSKAPLPQHRLRDLLDVSQCLCNAVKEGGNGRRLREQGNDRGHNPVRIYGSP